MRSLLCALLLVLAALLTPRPALAQVETKSMSYGTIRCDSFGPESTCPIDTSRGVRMVREFSRGRCVQGRTWGWDPYRIWVRDGCQAEFEIGGGAPGGGGGGREVVCESRSSRIHYCDADTRFGVELVQQLSRADCIRDRSWGYDRRAIWVSNGCRARFRLGTGGGSSFPPGGSWGGISPGNDPPGTRRVSCESSRGDRQYCQFPFAARDVQLVQDFGRNPCVQGRTWNWGEGGIWVERFCGGEFLVFPQAGGGWGGGWSGGGSNRIVCESHRDRVQHCPAGGIIVDAKIVRQLSNSPCIEGQSWGYNDQAVWVRDGCRAEFAVVAR
jgi:hypothetical protein